MIAACEPVRLIADCHRHQRHCDALARCQQHVQLARMPAPRIRRDLRRKRDQLVRRVAHCRHDDDDFRIAALRRSNPLRDAPDPIR
jgi:hypothetical protein